MNPAPPLHTRALRLACQALCLAGLAHSARAAGARVVVVNTADSALDDVAHAVVRGPAAVVLPALLGV